MEATCMACGSYGGGCEYCTYQQVPYYLMQQPQYEQHQQQYPGTLVPIEFVWELQQQVQMLQQAVSQKDQIIAFFHHERATMPRETVVYNDGGINERVMDPPSPVSHLLEAFDATSAVDVVEESAEPAVEPAVASEETASQDAIEEVLATIDSTAAIDSTATIDSSDAIDSAASCAFGHTNYKREALADEERLRTISTLAVFYYLAELAQHTTPPTTRPTTPSAPARHSASSRVTFCDFSDSSTTPSPTPTPAPSPVNSRAKRGPKRGRRAPIAKALFAKVPASKAPVAKASKTLVSADSTTRAIHSIGAMLSWVPRRVRKNCADLIKSVESVVSPIKNARERTIATLALMMVTVFALDEGNEWFNPDPSLIVMDDQQLSVVAMYICLAMEKRNLPTTRISNAIRALADIKETTGSDRVMLLCYDMMHDHIVRTFDAAGEPTLHGLFLMCAEVKPMAQMPAGWLHLHERVVRYYEDARDKFSAVMGHMPLLDGHMPLSFVDEKCYNTVISRFPHIYHVAPVEVQSVMHATVAQLMTCVRQTEELAMFSRVVITRREVYTQNQLVDVERMMNYICNFISTIVHRCALKQRAVGMRRR